MSGILLPVKVVVAMVLPTDTPAAGLVGSLTDCTAEFAAGVWVLGMGTGRVGSMICCLPGPATPPPLQYQHTNSLDLVNHYLFRGRQTWENARLEGDRDRQTENVFVGF